MSTAPVAVPERIADPELETRTLRRVAARLVPLVIPMFVVCYVDRANVGFAALQMNRALGLSATAYGLGAGVFFIAYMALEIPSNLMLARLGARRWIARIMISWGLISSATLFARGPLSFYVLRVLLGAAEAGFFPGIVFYLGEWFPGRARGRVMGAFITAIPIAGMITGPISGELLGWGGRLGLAGWQWLFLIEGIPSVLLGLLALRLLPDRPETAAWLPDAERRWLIQRLRLERERARAGQHHVNLRKVLAHPAVWQLALLEGLSVTSTNYGLTFWLPQVVKALSGAGDARVGLLTVLPWGAAVVSMLAVCAHSDRTRERCRHIAACSLVAALGFAAASFTRSTALALAALAIAAGGSFGLSGPFFALPAMFLEGEAAAAGIALMNSVANAMGFAIPYMMGLLRDATGGYAAGFRVLAVLPFAGAFVALRLGRAARFRMDAEPAPAVVPAGAVA